MKRTVVMFACTVLVCGMGVGVVSLHTSFTKKVSYAEELPFDELSVYMRTAAQEEGAAYAYDMLRELPQHSTINTHVLGHVIGEVLYAQQGIDGVGLCTSEFAFSCFHSVLGSAIAERGIDAVETLNSKCFELFEDLSGCQHGIGHGIVTIAGYEDIAPSLEICEKLAYRGSIEGCVGGVLMEFSGMIMKDTSGSNQRVLDSRGMYYPCDTLSAAYAGQCYYEQASWWRGLYGEDNFVKLGQLCASVENNDGRMWCFRRTGELLTKFDGYNTAFSIKTCQNDMPSIEGQTYCLQMINAMTEGKEDVCDLLDEPYHTMCLPLIPVI